MTRHLIDGPRRGVCRASGTSERPPSQLGRPRRTIFYERPRREASTYSPRRQPRDSSLAGPHRHSESVPLGSRAVRAMTGVAPIVFLSANVSERATRVSTPWLTGRQYPWLTGRQYSRVLRVAHRPSVPRLRTRAIRAGPSGRPRPLPCRQVPAPIVRRRGRRGASVAHAARPHRCWPGPGLKRSLASCDRLHPSQADLTTGDDGRAGSASISYPSQDDSAGPNRSGRPRAAGGPNGHPPPHAEPAQFDPDPGPRLRRWGLRALVKETVCLGVRVARACACWPQKRGRACAHT